MRNDDIIEFLDQSSPQTTSNTVKLWSFNKPEIIKNTNKLRANTFGFYCLNGSSAVDFQERSRKENVISFLRMVRKRNPVGRIVMILDNFKPHHSPETLEYAENNNILLIHLPPYSPDLNPIEFIWKSVKRDIFTKFLGSEEHLKYIVSNRFYWYSQKKTYARSWMKKFLSEEFINCNQLGT